MLAIKLISIFLIFCLICTTFIECMAMPSEPIYIPNSGGNGAGIGDIPSSVTEKSWLRRQLTKFGTAASGLGNAVGRATIDVSTTAEKICDLVKKLLPILAAICRIGQFKFCAPVEPGTMDTDFTNLEKLD